MTPLRAFVGHSFSEDDTVIVSKFLKYLDQLAELHPNFSWEHAEPAEPRVIDEKVMRLFADKKLFIGICTKSERCITPGALRPSLLARKRLNAREEDFGWKTSDWIIQEIGLAIGRNLYVILLVEKGLRSPGGLQGNLERIEFERNAPEKIFGKLVEMISALSPKAETMVLAETESRVSPPEKKDVSPTTESADWVTPKPDWNRPDYEFALRHFVAINDEVNVSAISDQYIKTESDAQSQNRKSWDAYKEYMYLSLGKGGSLSRLTKLADQNPDNSEIYKYVARIYRKYEDYGKAAAAFERAASVSDDIHDALELLGEAAYARQKTNDTPGAAALIALMKSKSAGTGQGETEVLRAERKLAEMTKDDEILIGTMERLLDLDPSDFDTRFALAYKYSEQGKDDLAAMHYARIPYAERTSVAWNNLGVAFDQLGLPAKSVNAYRKSEEMGETLAMSNLANKLIGTGFLFEAQKICDEALKLKEIHKNVGTTLGRIKEVPEEEDKKESDTVAKARPISEFYKDFGKAVAIPMPKTLAARWQGPDCVLDITLTESAFSATGSYERSPPTGMIAALYGVSGISGKPNDAPTRYQIEYQGITRGRAIVASVVREKEESAKATSALMSGEDRLTVLMVLRDDESEIFVLEKSKTGNPRFYSFKPC